MLYGCVWKMNCVKFSVCVLVCLLKRWVCRLVVCLVLMLICLMCIVIICWFVILIC